MTPPFPRFHAVGDTCETTLGAVVGALVLAALAGAIVGSLITALVMRGLA